MSKTDKTRPWVVKCLDDPSWLVEEHDHRAGPCDLPERPLKTTDPFGSLQTKCRWVASHDFWVQRSNGCGCRVCTARDLRKADRRKARHIAKAAARSELLDATVGPNIDAVTALSDGSAGLEDESRWLTGVGEALDLPAAVHVVDVDYLGGPFDLSTDCCDECAGPPRPESVLVTLMHGDGRREELLFDGPRIAFETACADGSIALHAVPVPARAC